MNQSKTYILIAAAVLLSGIAYFITAGGKESPVEAEALRIESRKGRQHIFEVEIAATPAAQEQGLMQRKSMAPDHGMLFQMGKVAVTRFWMKNTLIPLDMLFISPDGIIKKVHARAVPLSRESVSSDVPVAAVLEINGGRAAELGIAAGDRVIHPFFKPAAKK